MKNIFKSKKSILIMMFALVVIMGIGFAAYSQQLQIKDTSSIDSDWNVYIKDVSVPDNSSSATGSGAVDETTNLKADLTTDLKYPGDYVIYKLIVANDGNIDAVLEKINFSMQKEGTVIKYYYSVDDQNTWNEVSKNGENPYNEDLLAKTTDDFYVKVEYDPTKTGTATEEEKSNKLTLEFIYAQKTGGDIVLPENRVVYRHNSNSLGIGDSIDGVETTSDPSTLGKIIYLKHDIDSENKITSSYACFIAENNEYCLRGGRDNLDYDDNKAILESLESWFPGGCVSDSHIGFICRGNVEAITSVSPDYVYLGGSDGVCEITKGVAACE